MGNPRLPRGEIKPETPPVESPDVSLMQTVAKSIVDGMRIALAIALALLLACSVNVLLLYAWL